MDDQPSPSYLGMLICQVKFETIASDRDLCCLWRLNEQCEILRLTYDRTTKVIDIRSRLDRSVELPINAFR